VFDEDFRERFLATIEDPFKNGVHILFNEWWKFTPADVREAYDKVVTDNPDFEDFASGALYSEPLDLGELATLPDGSLGKTYHDWIIKNNLTASIALNYKALHDQHEATGGLDGMSPLMKAAVLRAYQTHDFQHVVTGYDDSSRGEIALQAFCLAQHQYPYFGMWIAVTTSRMTLVNPKMIVPMMDAITDGWQLGRATPNMQCIRWEELLDRPLEEVRSLVGLEMSSLALGFQEKRRLREVASSAHA
jgi:ubiquinone biosynthesis protein Coq4